MLKISVDLNDDTEIRQAVLTVKSGGAEAKINVRQLGTDPAILVDRDIFSLPSIGGNLDFEITTNVKLDVKLPDWITPPNEARAMRKEQRHYVVLVNKNDTKTFWTNRNHSNQSSERSGTTAQAYYYPPRWLS